MNPRREHGRNRSSGRIYFQNSANELTGITRNNELTVAGSLTNTPTSLSINGQNAGLYNDKTFAASGVGLNDGMNTFTAIMVTAGGSFTNSTTKTLPASVSLTSDLNGNLIYDGQKAYEYDCANELTSVTVSNSWRNEYVYDGFGRRRVAKNYVWYGGGWQEGAEKRYVYDGNNVIQERDGNNHVLVSYTRGTDLSGTMQDAGGIGGLLARTDSSGSAFYHADGNGNITMMIDSSGDQLAKYLYDSFGNTIGMWGTLAPINTYRFSSKEIDTRSGLYYYGERYYEPNYQRWLNQDPIEEIGGLNLYGYDGNNPVIFIDPYGFSFWGDFGNGLNNTVSGIGQSMGQGLYDLSQLTWSQNEYNRIGNLMYSLDTPENPAATPYVMGALGVSTAAATTAAVALGGEVAASRGCFNLSEHALIDSIGQEGRYWSETAARNAIKNGPRMLNYGGKKPIWNALTTFKYPIGNGGQIVLNPWTRTIVQYLPKW